MPNRQTLVQELSPGHMPKHSFDILKGEIHRFSFHSNSLKNQLDDPCEREILVYMPPNTVTPLPCIINLASFTSSGLQGASWKAFGETLPQRVERLIREGEMGPVILVMPDTFTSLGGNQYIDSKVMGNWGKWLSEDLISQLNKRFKISSFGLIGFSSGGYGSLVRGMLDNCWKAIAVHSGDCGFELLYKTAFPKTLTYIMKFGGYEQFLNHIQNINRLSGDDFEALMMCAMAASYDGINGIKLPINSETCELNEKRWGRWINWDPLHMIEKYQDLPPCYIDVGKYDQYHIQYGLKQLHNRMNDLDIKHYFEEFEGTHSGIKYRMDLSLPWMYKKMTSTS